MDKQLHKKILKYVEDNISDFHIRRIDAITELKLVRILKRKNPYLFRAKHLLTAETIVRKLVDAHISSNEETIFGNWLEGLAIFINEQIYNGRKSGISGIDLEFDKDNIRYIVSIKSGPNWGNSSQIKKMVTDFNNAIRTLRTSNSGINVIPVNGCCYGKVRTNYTKDNYYKYCGQEFWEFISGYPNLYIDIIEPIGYKAKEKNEEYLEAYSKLINRFTREFSNEFCFKSGDIDWESILKLNSQKES